MRSPEHFSFGKNCFFCFCFFVFVFFRSFVCFLLGYHIINTQGLRQDLKIWVCKKTGCVNPKNCVQSIGQVGKNWVCKTLPTQLAG